MISLTERISDVTAHDSQSPSASQESTDQKTLPNLVEADQTTRPRGLSLRRASSYVLLRRSWSGNSITKVNTNLKYGIDVETDASDDGPPLYESCLRLLATIVCRVILDGGSFRGLLPCLPSNLDKHVANYETRLHRRILSLVVDVLKQNLTDEHVPDLKSEGALAYFDNLYKLTRQGFFIDGSRHLLVSAASLYEITAGLQKQTWDLQRQQFMAALLKVMHKTLILQLELLLSAKNAPSSKSRLQVMLFWQQQLFTEPMEAGTIKIVLYLLYNICTVKTEELDTESLCDLWRAFILLQDQALDGAFDLEDVSTTLLLEDLRMLLQTDSTTFVSWLRTEFPRLDPFFRGTLAKPWDQFVSTENRIMEDSMTVRSNARDVSARSQQRKMAQVAETVHNHRVKLRDWYQSLQASEKGRDSRAHQDQADQAALSLRMWNSLHAEFFLNESLVCLDSGMTTSTWQVDPTENRLRVRKKLRACPLPSLGQQAGAPASHVPVSQQNDVVLPRVTAAAGVSDEPTDRYRRVSRSLQHDDVILDVANISRIAGLLSVQGLLVFGKHSLYIIDNYLVDEFGEIYDAWEARPSPGRDSILETLAKQASSQSSTKDLHRCRSWRYTSVTSISKRQFLLRDVALEIFFADGRSSLLTALTTSQRDLLGMRLFAKTTHLKEADAFERSQKSQLGFGGRLIQLFTESSPWDNAAAKWASHDLSNFEYLMTVNTLAGRSFNDLTQYPVFPWIIADYTSVELDLDAVTTFRDLAKNMGSQRPDRRRTFVERYAAFAEIDDKPFHFGTHYSSAMIAASYAIRLSPFTESYLLLQGGKFDHADRLFYSVEKAWISASARGTDVRELIPEFFYLPEMFKNPNNLTLGRGKDVQTDSTVELPAWAHGSAELFVERNRQALESPYVSRHLHLWIDLIFGYRQRGKEAVMATNVFHPFSYQGAIDLDKIDNPVERQAAIGIINNFGQTPKQLFDVPHVGRMPGVPKVTERRLSNLVQVSQANALEEAVGSISFSNELKVLPRSAAYCTSPKNLIVRWTTPDSSVRVFSEADSLLGIFEQLHHTIVLGVALEDRLILASADTTLSISRLTQSSHSTIELSIDAYLSGHHARVTALAVSKSMQSIASGAADGAVILWDLIRLAPARLVKLTAAIRAIALNDYTGDCAICTAASISVYTINGVLLASSSDMVGGEPETVYFHPSDVEAGHKRFFWTGHPHGCINLWSLVLGRGQSPWQIVHLKTYKQKTKIGQPGTVTAFSYHDGVLVTGDNHGRVTRWSVAVDGRP